MSQSLDSIIKRLSAVQIGVAPQIFDLSKDDDQAAFAKLLEDGAIRRVTDDFEEEQRELFAIRHPDRVYTPDFEQEFRQYYDDLAAQAPLHTHGRWAYFPWSATAAHVLVEEEYRIVRTARNRNLVPEEEQKRFYDARIGIGGLSVGSSVAFALALSGGGKRMKIADMDRLALSNTNRVLSGANELGALKVEMAARRIYEVNPYAELELHPEGLTPDNIESFMQDLDVMVDELDNLAVKYLIREQAKKHRIPVVMAADNGDNAVVDIERYDIDPQPEYFHGRLGDVSYESLSKLDKFGIGRTITQHIGPENVTERMQESLLEMGKTIVSWPQLGIAALINGAAVAYCIRRIVNGQSLETNRSLVSLDAALDPEYNSPDAVKHREEVSQNFAKMFGLA